MDALDRRDEQLDQVDEAETEAEGETELDERDAAEQDQDQEQDLVLEGDALLDHEQDLDQSQSQSQDDAMPRAACRSSPCASASSDSGLGSVSSSTSASSTRSARLARPAHPHALRRRAATDHASGLGLGSAEAPSRSNTRDRAASTFSLADTPRSLSSRSIASSTCDVDVQAERDLVASHLGLGVGVDLDLDRADALTVLDLSLMPKKAHKTLKSLQSLAMFPHLQQLDVANNAIPTLDGVDAFTELSDLNISRNHLKRLDAPLFSLEALTRLDLSGNFIAHLPRAITSLTVLEWLNLAGNNLSALKEVDVLASLANLHCCSFLGNPFCKLPTYKTYVLAKLQSLERLDELGVTAIARDKSRRRFSQDWCSRDRCLQLADQQHAQEQSKLREQQSALEEENQRLRGELQLKAKLLQNKSKAWSTANEQLLQLQQQVAMMNIEPTLTMTMQPARYTASPAAGGSAVPACGSCGYAASRPGSSGSRPSSAAACRSCPSPVGFVLDNLAAAVPRGRSEMETETSMEMETTEMEMAEGDGTSRRNSLGESKIMVDSACSPLRLGEQEIVLDPSRNGSPMKSIPTPVKPMPMLVPVPIPARISPSPLSRILTTNTPLTLEHFQLCRDLIDPDGNAASPIVEDDSGCPAYEDAAARFLAARSPSPSLPSAPSASPMLPPHSPSLRMWQRHHDQLQQQTRTDSAAPASSPATAPSSPPRSPPQQAKLNPKTKPPPLMTPLDKQQLVQQIQALQTCKQSLVRDIAREEQLLHALKAERRGVETERLRVEGDLDVLLGIDSVRASVVSAQQQQYQQQLEQQQQQQDPRRREIDVSRAKLEMCRSKLQFAQDKEKEIEAAIVRMTKQVLEEDLRVRKADERSAPLAAMTMGMTLGMGMSASAAFDKEVLALTHKLQLVIVEKEELQSELGVRMAKLRELCAESRGSASGSALLLSSPQASSPRRRAKTASSTCSTAASTTSSVADDAHTNSEVAVDPVFLLQQRQLDALQRRQQELSDRIRVKEALLASLIAELQDVENELAYINTQAPIGSSSTTPTNSSNSSTRQQRRPCAIPSELATSAASAMRVMPLVQDPSPMRWSSPDIQPQQSPQTANADVDVDPAQASPSPSSLVSPAPASAPLGPVQQVDALAMAAAAAAMPPDLRFRDVFSDEMLEQIKHEILDKICRQLMEPFRSPDRASSTAESASDPSIAAPPPPSTSLTILAAFEAHLQRAMERFLQRADNAAERQATAPSISISTPVSAAPSPSAPAVLAASASSPQLELESPSNHDAAARCESGTESPANVHTHANTDAAPSSPQYDPDQLDDFLPIDTTYIFKYRLVKELVPAALTAASSSSAVPNGSAASARHASLQRLLRACTRLEQAERESHVDPISHIDLDTTNHRKKSALHVLVQSARNLPTAHLRTQNLDPYVQLEVVYPTYIQQSSLSTDPEHVETTATSASRVCRTRTIKKSVYPTWDESFELAPIESLHGYLRVRVLNDRKLSREQVVGEARIPLRSLVHQRKVLESFSLQIDLAQRDHKTLLRSSSTSTSSSTSRPTKTTGSNGSVRLQLQLSFSQVERAKRTVDELVDKFVHEYQQLPPFMETIEAYATRTSDSMDMMDSPSASCGHADDGDPTGRAASPSRLQTFEAWKAQQEQQQQQQQQAQEQQKATTSQPDDEPKASANASPQSALSAARRASLWTTSSKALDDQSSQSKRAPSPDPSQQRATPPRTPTKPHTHVMTTPATPSIAPTCLRTSGSNSSSSRATSKRPASRISDSAAIANAAMRGRRGSSSSSRMDCFDADSIYNPAAFHALGLDSAPTICTRAPPNMPNTRRHGAHSGGHSHAHGHAHVHASAPSVTSASVTAPSVSRHTDLRIFKSPGFARREPAAGFPERFIGLDNQTSERLKRIFGRIEQ